MCGVVAALGRDRSGWDQVDQALEDLAHRGIRSAYRRSDVGAVGHVRLPIVGTDVKNDQPVVAGRWTIGFVGEILNFREIDPGADCDVHTVAKAWVAGGRDPWREFRTFDGFWSVVALDVVAGEIHVLTDYLAQKPVYYRADAHAIAAASEPRAVARMGPTTPDEVYMSSVVKWGYCPETWRTPYREVRKTLPGEYVVLDADNGIKSRRRVDTVPPIRFDRTWDVVEKTYDALRAANRRRVASADVPVACLLSGGLDSSLVYTLAREDQQEFSSTYHVPNPGDDPTRVAHHSLVTTLHNDTPSDCDALEMMQEPIDLGSLVPQASLSRMIARTGGERVCLTGDGADELFGGYSRALRYDSQASDVWHELVAWHLPRLDRVMMANRIEVRSPFLARDVVRIALGLPRAHRTNKQVLREIARELGLPREVWDGRKVPLRTCEVESDREGRSARLVEMFREITWGR